MTTSSGDRTVSVGDYTLLTKIGEGGMGVVHLARGADGHRVALKVLRPQVVGDDEGRERLAREVSSLGRVRSRWVAEILDADPWAPVPYIATRYVPGLALHDHVAEEGPVHGADLLWLAGCLAEGLDAVHAAGVLHRDVKPSNVLMEGRTPILIDFGLAKVADDPRLTQTGWLIGTPGYLAPEILYGDDATEASDVHSWAATVAFAGTGRAPFGRGPSAAIMDRVRRGEHDRLDEVGGDLARVLAAALHPDPDLRPTLPDVLDWLRPQTTQVRRVVPPPPVPVHVPEPAETEPWQPAATPWDRTEVHPDPADEWADESSGGWSDGSGASGEGHTRLLEQEHGWSEQPRAVPLLERTRRAALLVTAGAALVACLAAFPVLAAAATATLVWLLRGGSLAASSVGDRRRLRGRRWYDGPRLLLGAPWHLVRSLPGTLGLLLWATGAAAAAGLVCYAVATDEPTTLAACATAATLGLWWGPGSDRVRSPLARVLRPACATGGGWVVAVAAAGLVAGLAAYLAVGGADWTPLAERPLGDLSLPF